MKPVVFYSSNSIHLFIKKANNCLINFFNSDLHHLMEEKRILKVYKDKN